MRNSLQDQLFKAGLASKKQAVKAKKAKNTAEKNLRQNANVVSETAELAKKAEAEKPASGISLRQRRLVLAGGRSEP